MKSKIKEEKGSITLFVLTSILFFVVVLVVVLFLTVELLLLFFLLVEVFFVDLFKP